MRKSVLLVIFVLIFCFLKPTPVLAKLAPPDSTYSGYDFTISSPRFVSGDLGGEQCPVSCDHPSQCANTENANNCNKPACPPGGNAWTTYNLNCVMKEVNVELQTGTCEPQYYIGAVVYSNGDKCTSGGPYLNPGYCESAFGGPVYKTCCSSDGNALSPFQCVAFDADGSGDPEGRCPAGYEREVFCGGAGEPACGQEACGSTGPTGPECGNGICESGEDSSSCPNDCPAQQEPSGPSLNSFAGSSSCPDPARYLAPYKASLSWSGNPYDTGSCGTGFWVDQNIS